MEYLTIIFVSIFVNNVIFAQFLGMCPFLGVSSKVKTAVGMGAAVTFVMVLATVSTFLLQVKVLDPFGIGYLQTIVFILVIASLVQMVELILKKVSQPLYQALGVFLPLITTNCAILGTTVIVFKKNLDLISGTIYAFGTAVGFALAIVIFAGIRERLDLMDVPEAMKGAPIALVTTGLLALAFLGFSGMG